MVAANFRSLRRSTQIARPAIHVYRFTGPDCIAVPSLSRVYRPFSAHRSGLDTSSAARDIFAGTKPAVANVRPEIIRMPRHVEASFLYRLVATRDRMSAWT